MQLATGALFGSYCRWQSANHRCGPGLRPNFTTVYSVSQKNPPCGFLTFFPNGWEFLINFLHTYLYVHIYARLQIYFYSIISNFNEVMPY